MCTNNSLPGAVGMTSLVYVKHILLVASWVSVSLLSFLACEMWLSNPFCVFNEGPCTVFHHYWTLPKFLCISFELSPINKSKILLKMLLNGINCMYSYSVFRLFFSRFQASHLTFCWHFLFVLCSTLQANWNDSLQYLGLWCFSVQSIYFISLSSLEAKTQQKSIALSYTYNFTNFTVFVTLKRLPVLISVLSAFKRVVRVVDTKLSWLYGTYSVDSL